MLTCECIKLTEIRTINSFWLSDTIWRQKSEKTLAQHQTIITWTNRDSKLLTSVWVLGTHGPWSVLVYKCLNGLAPQYLCKLLHFYAKDRDLRSADDKTLLEMPQSRTKFGERAFCYYAPKIWNSLPKDIRSSKSIDTFKKKVKTHLFSLAYHGKWLLKLII